MNNNEDEKATFIDSFKWKQIELKVKDTVMTNQQSDPVRIQRIRKLHNEIQWKYQRYMRPGHPVVLKANKDGIKSSKSYQQNNETSKCSEIIFECTISKEWHPISIISNKCEIAPAPDPTFKFWCDKAIKTSPNAKEYKLYDLHTDNSDLIYSLPQLQRKLLFTGYININIGLRLSDLVVSIMILFSENPDPDKTLVIHPAALKYYDLPQLQNSK